MKRANAPYEIMVSPRNAQKARELQQRFGVAIASNQDIVDACDLVVVSVVAATGGGGSRGAAGSAPGQTVLSVMAGVPLEGIGKLIRAVRPQPPAPSR